MAAEQLTPAQKKEQQNAYQREWRAKRSAEQKEREADAKREYMRQWNAANKEHVRNHRRERKLAQPALVRAIRSAQYRKIREKLLAKLREEHKKNPEIGRAKNRKNRQAHLEKRRESVREWVRKNPEKKLTHIRNRDALKRNAPGKHTAADIAALFETQNGLCGACNAVLIKTGKGRFHADHVIPLKRGGSNNPDNLQLLCPFCNLSKGDKHPDDWARSRGRLFA